MSAHAASTVENKVTIHVVSCLIIKYFVSGIHQGLMDAVFMPTERSEVGYQNEFSFSTTTSLLNL